MVKSTASLARVQAALNRIMNCCSQLLFSIAVLSIAHLLQIQLFHLQVSHFSLLCFSLYGLTIVCESCWIDRVVNLILLLMFTQIEVNSVCSQKEKQEVELNMQSVVWWYVGLNQYSLLTLVQLLLGWVTDCLVTGKRSWYDHLGQLNSVPAEARWAHSFVSGGR